MSRGDVSMLNKVGLQELIAQTPEAYIAVARSLARDVPRIMEIRSNLRQPMQQSPLMDVKASTQTQKEKTDEQVFVHNGTSKEMR